MCKHFITLQQCLLDCLGHSKNPMTDCQIRTTPVRLVGGDSFARVPDATVKFSSVPELAAFLTSIRLSVCLQKASQALTIAPNLCSYTSLAKQNCYISMCLTTSTGFISTNFFVLESDFELFAEIHQKKMLITHMLQFGTTPTSKFLCVITNQIIDMQ